MNRLGDTASQRLTANVWQGLLIFAIAIAMGCTMHMTETKPTREGTHIRISDHRG